MSTELCKKLDWMYSLINPVGRSVTIQDVERLKEAFVELFNEYKEDFSRYILEDNSKQIIIPLC